MLCLDSSVWVVSSVVTSLCYKYGSEFNIHVIYHIFDPIHWHFTNAMVEWVRINFNGLSLMNLDSTVYSPEWDIRTNKKWRIMHELPWITNFGPRVRRFAYDFHEWRSLECKSLASHYEWTQNHSNECIILFLTRYRMSWTHNGRSLI